MQRLVQRQAQHVFPVYSGDEIARHHASSSGRGVVDRRHDLDPAFFLRDFQTQPAEFTARLHLHVLGIVLGQIGRMWVQRGQHPVDRGLDQFLVVHILDIALTDPLENIAEQVELFINVSIRSGGLRDQRSGKLRGGHKAKHSATGGGHQKLLHA